MAWHGENFGFALKALAQAIEPDRPALIHADRTITWAELDRITDAIAAGLAARGLKPGDVAGQMLRNAPEYLLAYFGCAKAGVTPVNINYHYTGRELTDIFNRFALRALFVEPELAELAAGAMPPGALEPYAAVPGDARWDELCSTPVPDDFACCDDTSTKFYMATGGTTGMPKAVVWPFGEAWGGLKISTWAPNPAEEPLITQSLAEQCARAAQVTPGHKDSISPMLVLCPLMHGTAQYGAVGNLLRGGTIVTMPGQKFDPDAVLDTVKAKAVRTMVIVGDAFAKPLVDALQARDDASDAIASLRSIGSSGAIFSESNKQRLLAFNPAMFISDVLGSSESGGTAVKITTIEGTSGEGRFMPPPLQDVRLFDENLNEIPKGSDGIGIVARSGSLPLGYLGEDEKNAQTFPVIGGVRYLMTGDRARWGADDTLEFIGRDNMCINTGGEKVFPEEVEAVLQEHPAVKDVRVLGLPDPRFGMKIAAVVAASDGAGEALQASLDAHAREGLAGYKVPRLYLFTRESLRLNNGKPDYKTAQRIADEAVT